MFKVKIGYIVWWFCDDLVICVLLTDCINSAILNVVFPDELKLADVTPLYKKSDPEDKTNYQPISISKVFHCPAHDLITAKLHAYGLDRDSLRLLRSYLSNWYQRIKLNSVFSLWMQTIIGVSQVSILGSHLFNIFSNYLLLINLRSIVCNFADDNTLYYCGGTTENVIKNLQLHLKIVLKWFRNNEMMTNLGKFQ